MGNSQSKQLPQPHPDKMGIAQNDSIAHHGDSAQVAIEPDQSSQNTQYPSLPSRPHTNQVLGRLFTWPSEGQGSTTGNHLLSGNGVDQYVPFADDKVGPAPIAIHPSRLAMLEQPAADEDSFGNVGYPRGPKRHRGTAANLIPLRSRRRRSDTNSRIDGPCPSQDTHGAMEFEKEYESASNHPNGPLQLPKDFQYQSSSYIDQDRYSPGTRRTMKMRHRALGRLSSSININLASTGEPPVTIIAARKDIQDNFHDLQSIENQRPQIDGQRHAMKPTLDINNDQYQRERWEKLLLHTRNMAELKKICDILSRRHKKSKIQNLRKLIRGQNLSCEILNTLDAGLMDESSHQTDSRLLSTYVTQIKTWLLRADLEWHGVKDLLQTEVIKRRQSRQRNRRLARLSRLGSPPSRLIGDGTSDHPIQFVSDIEAFAEQQDFIPLG